MKKIQKTITNMILFNVIIAFVLITLFSMIRMRAFYLESVSKRTEKDVIHQAYVFEEDMIDVESTTKALVAFVESSFDVEKFKTDESYMDDFVQEIDPYFKRMALETSDLGSTYIYFDPTYMNGQVYDVWYADLNYSGKIQKQPSTNLDYFTDENDHKKWYFVPLRTKSFYWSMPFSGQNEFSSHMTFVSNSGPVLIEDQVIGVVGSDYNYEKVTQHIENYKGIGQAFLVDQHYQLIAASSDIDLSAIRQDLSGKVMKDHDYTIIYSEMMNGWYYGVLYEDGQVLEWYHHLLINVLLLGLLIVIFLYLYARYTSKKLIQPLESQAYHDEQMTLPEGLLMRDDEVGLLSREIDDMQKLQKKFFKTMEDQNLLLEEMIEKRSLSIKENNYLLSEAVQASQDKSRELNDLNDELEHAIEAMHDTRKKIVEIEKRSTLSYVITKWAHEFNTPVGSYITMLSFLKERVSNIEEKGMPLFIKQFQKTHYIIHESLVELEDLISKLTEMDKMHEVKPVQINVKDFIDMIIKTLNYPKIGFINHSDDLILLIDNGKFSQIVYHLLDNAARHAYDGHTGHVRIYASRQDDDLVLRVEDDGKGMTEAVKNDIFVPFYSGGIHYKTSGVGMSVVYNIVKNVFDGHIECESEVDKGSVFWCQLKVSGWPHEFE
ncbi:hypothetical protein EZV73_14380 [Acidaminobacter sp. JC074]|uniref:cache domain-containing sensor histidine kinase n=1 Tax=Acidaminobacter sp. JC074 TaxID=2530199 RepID=UPI001F0D53C6|nr:ATP-binding protein [Acidaminobacter sp. JC074]MCH4888778.1 hypothetical protein [Acidaminobacter sp. JC074]